MPNQRKKKWTVTGESLSTAFGAVCGVVVVFAKTRLSNDAKSYQNKGKSTEISRFQCFFGGDKRDRTADLLNAIVMRLCIQVNMMWILGQNDTEWLFWIPLRFDWYRTFCFYSGTNSGTKSFPRFKKFRVVSIEPPENPNSRKEESKWVWSPSRKPQRIGAFPFNWYGVIAAKNVFRRPLCMTGSGLTGRCPSPGSWGIWACSYAAASQKVASAAQFRICRFVQLSAN